MTASPLSKAVLSAFDAGLLKFNPNHDEAGRFSEGDSSGAVLAPQDISKPELDAINRYSGPTNYRRMNNGLRGVRELRPNDTKAIAHIDAVIERSSGLPYNSLLFRGVHLETFPGRVDPKPGDVLTDPGYTSTSFSKAFADNWNYTDRLIVINAPKGTKGLATSKLSFGGRPVLGNGQSEYILARGTSFRVDRVEQRRIEWDVGGGQKAGYEHSIIHVSIVSHKGVTVFWDDGPELTKFNQNHDEQGRFSESDASGDGATEFHGTRIGNLKSILETGLKAGSKRSFDISDTAKVYLAANEFEARQYANVIARGQARGGSKTKDPEYAILELRVPKDAVATLERDPLSIGGTAVTYKGDIPKEWIVGYKIYQTGNLFGADDEETKPVKEVHVRKAEYVTRFMPLFASMLKSEPVLKFNLNHDDKGRFSESDSPPNEFGLTEKPVGVIQSRKPTVDAGDVFISLVGTDVNAYLRYGASSLTAEARADDFDQFAHAAEHAAPIPHMNSTRDLGRRVYTRGFTGDNASRLANVKNTITKLDNDLKSSRLAADAVVYYKLENSGEHLFSGQTIHERGYITGSSAAEHAGWRNDFSVSRDTPYGKQPVLGRDIIVALSVPKGTPALSLGRSGVLLERGLTYRISRVVRDERSGSHRPALIRARVVPIGAQKLADAILAKFNPNHDERGRFSESDGGPIEGVKAQRAFEATIKSVDLSRAQEVQIESYKGSGYRSLNAYLRGRSPVLREVDVKDREMAIFRLDGVFDNHALPLPRDVTVYRNVGPSFPIDELQPGRNYLERGYLSTSLDKYANIIGGAGSGMHQIEIRLPKGANAISTDHLGQAFTQSEHEVLLGRNAVLHIDYVAPRYHGSQDLYIKAHYVGRAKDDPNYRAKRVHVLGKGALADALMRFDRFTLMSGDWTEYDGDTDDLVKFNPNHDEAGRFSESDYQTNTDGGPSVPPDIAERWLGWEHVSDVRQAHEMLLTGNPRLKPGVARTDARVLNNLLRSAPTHDELYRGMTISPENWDAFKSQWREGSQQRLAVMSTTGRYAEAEKFSELGGIEFGGHAVVITVKGAPGLQLPQSAMDEYLTAGRFKIESVKYSKDSTGRPRMESTIRFLEGFGRL